MSQVALIDQALDRARLSPREAIVRTLLEWYQDALEGWREVGTGDGEGMGVELMGVAWHHPSYQELERARLEMRDALPRTYWHLAERYIRPVTQVALRCPNCHAVGDWPRPGHKQPTHRHGGLRVEFARASVLVVSGAVRPELVADGVRWLAVAFRGDPFVPDTLKPRSSTTDEQAA